LHGGFGRPQHGQVFEVGIHVVQRVVKSFEEGGHRQERLRWKLGLLVHHHYERVHAVNHFEQTL
jgi:hypothetical protein